MTDRSADFRVPMGELKTLFAEEVRICQGLGYSRFGGLDRLVRALTETWLLAYHLGKEDAGENAHKAVCTLLAALDGLSCYLRDEVVKQADSEDAKLVFAFLGKRFETFVVDLTTALGWSMQRWEEEKGEGPDAR